MKENKNEVDNIEIGFENNVFQICNTNTGITTEVSPMELYEKGFTYSFELCSFFSQSVQAENRHIMFYFTDDASKNLTTILEFNILIL